MSLDVHQIRWRSSYLEIDYSSRDGGVPWLYCVGRCQFVPFEIVGLESGVRRARLNLVLGDGREVLPGGQWIICEKIKGVGARQSAGAVRRIPAHAAARRLRCTSPAAPGVA